LDNSKLYHGARDAIDTKAFKSNGNSTISAAAVRNPDQTWHGSDFVTVDVCAESAVS